MKNKFQRILTILLIVVVTFAITCKKSNQSSDDSWLSGFIQNYLTAYTISDLTKELSDTKIVPNYTAFYNSALRLRDLVIVYEAVQNTSNLQNIRDQWLTTYLLFKRIEWVNFGPAVSPRNAYIFIDSYTKSLPIVIATIETNITNGSNPSGVQTMGLDAMEYILFKSDLSTTNTDFTGGGGLNRRNYLRKLADDVVTRANLLKTDWDSSRTTSFYYEFILAGQSSDDFPLAKDALNEITNLNIFQANLMIDVKVGEPSGLRASANGVVDILKVEAPNSKKSIPAIIANLEGYDDLMDGGLSKYLSSRNPELEARIRKHIKDCKVVAEEIQSTHGDLATAINTDIGLVAELLKELKELRVLFTTELVSTIGGTIGVSSNDGD